MTSHCFDMAMFIKEGGYSIINPIIRSSIYENLFMKSVYFGKAKSEFIVLYRALKMSSLYKSDFKITIALHEMIPKETIEF